MLQGDGKYALITGRFATGRCCQCFGGRHGACAGTQLCGPPIVSFQHSQTVFSCWVLMQWNVIHSRGPRDPPYIPPYPKTRPDPANNITFWALFPISVACCPMSLHLLRRRRIPDIRVRLPHALCGRVLHPEFAEDHSVCHRDTPLECPILFVRTRPGQKTTCLLASPPLLLHHAFSQGQPCLATIEEMIRFCVEKNTLLARHLWISDDDANVQVGSEGVR